jgi:hypothetical protein
LPPALRRTTFLGWLYLFSGLLVCKLGHKPRLSYGGHVVNLIATSVFSDKGYDCLRCICR